MDISISKHNQEWIRRKIESGLYPSADVVVSTALGLLERLDPDLERELADVRERVRTSTEQADAGMLIPGKEVFDELRRRNAAFRHKEQ